MIMEAQLKLSYFSEDLGSLSYVNTIYQHMSHAEKHLLKNEDDLCLHT